MECDPQEHVTLWNCSHGVRINEPVCLECLMEEKEPSELPGWPLIILGFIAIASSTYLILEMIILSAHVNHFFSVLERTVP